MALVEGGAGLGKTALLEECARRASNRGWSTLQARGSELEAAFGFGVVRQLFERELAAMVATDRAAVAAGPAAAAVDFLLGSNGLAEARDSSFAVIHGLYWLTANMADGQSVLISVDDVQWADSASMRWLAYLAPRLDGLAVAVVVAERATPTARHGAATSAIRSVAGSIRPTLLDAAAATLVRHELGSGQRRPVRSVVAFERRKPLLPRRADSFPAGSRA